MLALSLTAEKESGSKHQVSTLSNFWWDNIILTLLLAINSVQSITSYFRIVSHATPLNQKERGVW